MRLFLLILLSVTVAGANAQDLTGIWRGNFKSAGSSKLYDSLGIDDSYKFETQIEQSSKAFKGVTYSYRSTVFYGKAECYGAINPKTKKVLLEENKLLEVQSFGGGACLMTLFLQYSKVGKEEFLEGTFTAMDVKDSTACPGGTVYLRKVPTSDFYKEPFLVEKEKNKPAPPAAKNNTSETKITPVQPPVAKKTPPPTPSHNPPAAAKKPPVVKNTPKPEQKKPAPPPLKKTDVLKQLSTDTFEKIAPRTNFGTPVPRVLETRVNELVKTIVTSANTISIKIYDNGTVDNDTVSVYIDNKLVVSKGRLTEKPIELTVNLDDKANFHELVMVAENLGEIPPNTSLMVVTAGDKQYEVRITSTEQKNAVLHFKKE